jgi:hypothetical protein
VRRKGLPVFSKLSIRFAPRPRWRESGLHAGCGAPLRGRTGLGAWAPAVLGRYASRPEAWGRTGAPWGGGPGFVFGTASFSLPDLGGLATAGPLESCLPGILGGTLLVGGAGALWAGLAALGAHRRPPPRTPAASGAGTFALVSRGTAVHALRDRNRPAPPWAPDGPGPSPAQEHP